MVSMFNSPPKVPGGGLWPQSRGLPATRPPRLGEVSNPFVEGDTLVGGDVLKPCDETGERIGDGERFRAANKAVLVERPAMYMESRFEAWSVSACSPWTRSANDTKLRRLISAGSRPP